jgi:Putative MetA-pathway of phenol degradation
MPIRVSGVPSPIRNAHRKTFTVFTALTLFMLTFVLTPSVKAQTINQNEYVTAPAGTNLAIGYYVHENLVDDNIKNGGTLRNNTHLTVDLGIARYVHYFDVGGYTAVLQFIQPFGAEYNAEVGGFHLPSTVGASDTTLSAVIWPVSDPASKTYIGVAGFLNIPDGTYDKHAALNLGDNMTSGVIQVGLNKGFGERFSIDLAADVQLYTSNSLAGNGSETLRANPSFRIQSFFNYNPFAGATIGVGFTGIYGGIETLDHFRTGSKAGPELDRIKLDASMFLSPTWQVLGEISHDLNAVGGFREEFGSTVRVLKVF